MFRGITLLLFIRLCLGGCEDNVVVIGANVVETPSYGFGER